MSDKYDRHGAKKIVVHHLGDKLASTKDLAELQRRANPYKYQYAEYDFGVLGDGTIVELRPLDYIGAHCKATVSKYIHVGEPNWWNKNSIGVVLAIDAENFTPSNEMIEGLVQLLVRLCKSQGITMDDVYPHRQVTATACPCCTYGKIGATGTWNYDYVEQEVNRRLAGNYNPAPQPPTPAPQVDPEKIALQNENIQLKKQVTDLTARLNQIKGLASV